MISAVLQMCEAKGQKPDNFISGGVLEDLSAKRFVIDSVSQNSPYYAREYVGEASGTIMPDGIEGSFELAFNLKAWVDGDFYESGVSSSTADIWRGSIQLNNTLSGNDLGTFEIPHGLAKSIIKKDS